MSYVFCLICLLEKEINKKFTLKGTGSSDGYDFF
jgi:hypothetical protein